MERTSSRPTSLVYTFLIFLALFICYHLAETSITNYNSILGFLGYFTAFFVFCWLLPREKGMTPWGLGYSKRGLTYMIVGVSIGLLLYSSVWFLSTELGCEKLIYQPSFSSIILQLGYWGFGSALTSVAEDILTRGWVYRYFGAILKKWQLALLSALIYWLNHIHRIDEGWITFGYLFLLGILLIIPLLYTQQLWITCGIHWAGNVFYHLTHSICKSQENVHCQMPSNILMIIMTSLFILSTLLLSKKLQ